jgi:hypothetical protein
VGHLDSKRRVDVFLAGGKMRHKKDSKCIFGWWDSKTKKRRESTKRASGTVRHKTESGCIFGWWDSEAQKGEWVYLRLVGQ